MSTAIATEAWSFYTNSPPPSGPIPRLAYEGDEGEVAFAESLERALKGATVPLLGLWLYYFGFGLRSRAYFSLLRNANDET
jgi:hypothetical protein